jgi:hypothetical protein
MQDIPYNVSSLVPTVESSREAHNVRSLSLECGRFPLPESSSRVTFGTQTMLLTTLRFATLVWLGAIVTAMGVLAALYMFDIAAPVIRRRRARWR